MSRAEATNRRRQYTLRGVPRAVDEALRRRAEEQGTSLNEAALEALQRGLGLEPPDEPNHAFDDLAGTWEADPECDSVLDGMRERIDWELWP